MSQGEDKPEEKRERTMGQRMGIAALILSASILLSRLLGCGLKR